MPTPPIPATIPVNYATIPINYDGTTQYASIVIHPRNKGVSEARFNEIVAEIEELIPSGEPQAIHLLEHYPFPIEKRIRERFESFMLQGNPIITIGDALYVVSNKKIGCLITINANLNHK